MSSPEQGSIFSEDILANIDQIMAMKRQPYNLAYNLLLLLHRHDLGTYLHSLAVHQLSEVLAGAYNIDSKELQMAALLHDIGKLIVPKRILVRECRGCLSDWDRRTLASHTQHSGDILSYLEFPPLVSAVGYNHERSYSDLKNSLDLIIRGIHIPTLVKVADNFAAGIDPNRPYNKGGRKPDVVANSIRLKIRIGHIPEYFNYGVGVIENSELTFEDLTGSAALDNVLQLIYQKAA